MENVLEESQIIHKAEELRDSLIAQILEQRKCIANEMLTKGLLPDAWVIVDNAEEVLRDPTVPYQYYVHPIWEDIEDKQ